MTKPLKDEGSTPAGVPHLQEVGYTVTYEDVLVTAEYLKQLKAEIKTADVRAKYGLFRSSLFYGNLRRWQRQGWHCVYTNGEGTEHCTCGLVVHKNGSEEHELGVVINPDVQEKLHGIELDLIHWIKGHLQLPLLKGQTLALIVNFIYKEEINDYLWTVICQECGQFENKVRHADAKSFVKTHNKSCGLVPNKRKEK